MKKLIAPFTLFQHEKIYYWWVFSILIVLIIGFFVPGFSSFFSEGQGLVFVIALLVPFVPELLFPNIVETKNKKMPKFSTYRTSCVISSFILIFILYSLFQNIEKLSEVCSILCQSISILLGLIVVIYSYVVTKMDQHQAHFALYDDIPYSDQEDANVDDLSKKANKRDKVGDVSL